ncbi:MBL fold metallo-hydrolase [Halarsenatibacter silvermanii]|uniref:7,8-dihydropterin-6-yl-methyl-4-(Beta-D-ribofuranosyl)aminobenzene 5'-phosphate synthase n=1 Tax=Halarsenatibacter silvermanii TaxID=321763 RepID=A0A1G9S1W8_9FIRM|nr:MBL fold metallo-hydrolase [Halarsenatibacter silvermanii]SDM29412.1 7,8-dihydropterin-6-yl-methyl-4-(beta-D-ribofuranosyl)aminobenzene 5'-phosphate synthase [Halarsenatibacter silvermanii]
MNFRIHPFWWPLLVVLSPLIIPYLLLKYRYFQKNKKKAMETNRAKISRAEPLQLQTAEQVEITVITEGKSKPGYKSEPGISYLLETENNKIIYDLSMRSGSEIFDHNFAKLSLNSSRPDAVVISHLHPDHMGGIRAARKNEVKIPESHFFLTSDDESLPVYLPADAEVSPGKAITVNSPQLITESLATTGPLTGNLFFSGPTREQALIIKLKNKGKIIITGCGHQGLKPLIKLSEKIVPGDIYALAGGLHLPVKSSRMKKAGIDLQRIIGTGKSPWQKPGRDELNNTIKLINEVNPERVLLSPHDSSDFALRALQKQLSAKTDILKSGDSFTI